MSFNAKKESAGLFTSFEEATQYLERMCRVLGVKHISYWSLSVVDGMPDQVTWIATYDPGYMAHYMGQHTPLGDPAFEQALERSQVIDWTELNASDAIAEKIQSQAVRFGIARHGLSYPFRDGSSRHIMFSVNIECSDADWPREKSRVTAMFCGFARYFHERARPLVDSRRAAA